MLGWDRVACEVLVSETSVEGALALVVVVMKFCVAGGHVSFFCADAIR